MTFPFVTHHGATRGVTGSCHQLHLDSDCSVLIDCGLLQGRDAPRHGTTRIDFDIQGVAALLITHVHIDHVGRIPDLLAAGFRGPILCSEPSAKLLPLVLEDAFKLAVSRESSRVERYIDYVRQAIVAIPFGQWHDLLQRDGVSCRVRLQRAGHLLGSAYIECDVQCSNVSQSTRVVFSGDLGAPHNPLLRPVESPERADILVLESTYGDRLHAERDTRQQRLEAVIDRAMADQGTILIPAFSLGRTQELLYEIEDILHRKALLSDAVTQVQGEPVDWPQLPVILDSPLASRLTQAYRELNHYWNDAARERLREGRRPLRFQQLISLDSHGQHQQVVNYLKSTGRPAIVIAGNGMCSSGRIVNYLKAMLDDPRHEIVFVGYQAKGTPGAVIQASEGAEGFVMIDLDGELYEVRAKVITLEGYSAHADQAGLVNFVTGMREWPARIVLVHGEEKARKGLERALRFQYLRVGKQVEVHRPD